MKKSVFAAAAVAIFACGLILGSIGLGKDGAAKAELYKCEAVAIMGNNELAEAKLSLQRCSVVLNKQKDRSNCNVKMN
jgi:hypothetical protein